MTMKRSHLIAAAAVALAAGLALTACSVIPAAGTGAAPQSSAPGAPRFGGAAGTFPGASGTIAAVNGSTAQVQSTSSQTAVSWTTSTAFTAQVAAAASDVTVGSCIVARPATGGSGSGASGSTGSSTTMAAATIEVTPATNGTCTPTGFGARPGGERSGPRPSRAPGSGFAGGMPSGGGHGGFGATGQVTAIGDGSFTVSVERFARSGGSTAAPQKTAETVTWSSSTTFTAQRAATAAAVQVGQCMTAVGKSDDTGAVTATRITISAPVDGSCTSGFGFGRGGAGRGGNGSGTTNG